ncbi:hypothetical protein AAF712_010892 [Marasmius tenuissimus]|uniref:Ubiquitin-like protease family profile domain-containing protein n=1 Tax=Marasmius tenuissimus TaxID=585030 RepID=A0ABR2ZLU1_9AGAR
MSMFKDPEYCKLTSTACLPKACDRCRKGRLLPSSHCLRQDSGHVPSPIQNITVESEVNEEERREGDQVDSGGEGDSEGESSDDVEIQWVRRGGEGPASRVEGDDSGGDEDDLMLTWAPPPSLEHWALAVVDAKVRHIHIFVSLGPKSFFGEWLPRIQLVVTCSVKLAQDQGYALASKTFLCLLDWTARPLDVVRRQSNDYDYDCGTWVLWAVAAVTRGFDCAYLDEKDIERFRKFRRRSTSHVAIPSTTSEKNKSRPKASKTCSDANKTEDADDSGEEIQEQELHQLIQNYPLGVTLPWNMPDDKKLRKKGVRNLSRTEQATLATACNSQAEHPLKFETFSPAPNIRRIAILTPNSKGNRVSIFAEDVEELVNKKIETNDTAMVVDEQGKLADSEVDELADSQTSNDDPFSIRSAQNDDDDCGSPQKLKRKKAKKPTVKGKGRAIGAAPTRPTIPSQ